MNVASNSCIDLNDKKFMQPQIVKTNTLMMVDDTDELEYQVI